MAIWESGRESSLLDAILDGRKTVEGRLKRGKFAEYRTGDYVWLRRDFRGPDGQLRDGTERAALVIIESIHLYRTFLEMTRAEGHENVIPGSASPEAATAEYDRFYPAEDQACYGVLAIRIRPVDAKTFSHT